MTKSQGQKPHIRTEAIALCGRARHGHQRLFTFTIILTQKVWWQVAPGIVFWAGVVFLVISFKTLISSFSSATSLYALAAASVGLILLNTRWFLKNGAGFNPGGNRESKMKNIKLTVIAIALLLSCAGAFSVSAQPKNAGKLNSWTTRPIERRHENTELTHLRVVRAAKQKGFDRIVFEFVGPMPNFSVKYHPSRFYEDESGRHPIKIAGNTFVHVNLNMIPVDEEQLKFTQAADFSPKGRLKLPVLWEVDEAGFFEGHYDFLLGVKSRRSFRVIELSSPTRLVIDFKH